MIPKCPSSFSYFIDTNKITRNLSADIEFNEIDKSIISQDLNLMDGLNENKDGYLICDFLRNDSMENLTNSVLNYISKKFGETITSKNYNEFFLKMDTSYFHKKMKQVYEGIPFSALPFNINFLENWASDILQKKVKLFYLKEPTLLIRIIRPFASDFNPPHRDVYINRLRNKVNCFMPLLGVNSESSLPIIPKSHNWKESETTRTKLNPTIDGVKFSVPAMLYKKDLSPLILTRPKVNYGQVMIFSPYCIHGGAKNFSKETRMSFEFRFKIP